jgi:predicted transposase YdaD
VDIHPVYNDRRGDRQRCLAALSADAHERAVAEDILAHLQHVIGKKPSRTPEEEEFIVSMHGTWKEAEEQGREQGRAEGRNEGRNEGEARALLTVLRGRGITVPDMARERILAEKDPARLERWIERAVVAASLAEVLDDPS